MIGLLCIIGSFGRFLCSCLLCGITDDCIETTKVCTFLYLWFPNLYGELWDPNWTDGTFKIDVFW